MIYSSVCIENSDQYVYRVAPIVPMDKRIVTFVCVFAALEQKADKDRQVVGHPAKQWSPR